MGEPLSSTTTSQLQGLENELEQYLKEAEKGKENKQLLFHVRDELKKLSKNVPEDVRFKLQQALQDLHATTASGTQVDPEKVQEAKDQIREIVAANKSGF